MTNYKRFATIVISRDLQARLEKLKVSIPGTDRKESYGEVISRLAEAKEKIPEIQVSKPEKVIVPKKSTRIDTKELNLEDAVELVERRKVKTLVSIRSE